MFKKIMAVAVLAVLAMACTSPAERAAKYLASAQALYDKGDYKKADVEARNAAQIEPKNAKARYLLALIAEKQQDFRQMFGHLQVAVDSDPNNVAARIKLGALYLIAQGWKEAEAQAKAALALAPDNPAAHSLQARVLLQQGKSAEAMKELDVALSKKPDYVEALVLKVALMAKTSPNEAMQVVDAALPKISGEDAKTLRELRIGILVQQNRMPEVEQGFRDLVKEFPKDERLQFQFARFYASQGRVDDAERVMRDVVALEPRDDLAKLGLAQFLAEMRSPAAAEKALEDFVAQTPDAPKLRLALGRIYEANKKPDAAASAYQELAKRSPKTPEGIEARVRIAALAVVKGDIATGQAEIDRVLADSPDQVDALLIRAGLRVGERKYDDAIADIRTVVRKEPANKRALLTLARVYALKGDRPLAKDSYRQLLTLDPANTEAPRELALVQASEGDFKSAQDVLRKRLDLDTKDMTARVQLFNMKLQQKDFTGAEDEAREISRLDDQKGVGDLQMGRALLAQRKFPQALEAFKRALERNPDWTLALEGVIGTMLQMDRKDEALAFAQTYVQKNPANPAGKILLGSVRKARGENAEAEKMFEAVIAEQPKAVAGYTSIASLYPKDREKRIEILRRGVKVAPDSLELAVLLGGELEQAGRFEEAIAHYEASLKANPNFEIVANNLAATLLDRRTDTASYSRALALVKRLDKSTNAGVLDTIGWAYFRNGDYANAVVFLEKALAATDFPQFRYHLGMAYAKQNKADKARSELRKAVESKAQFPGLEEARAELKKLGYVG